MSRSKLKWVLIGALTCAAACSNKKASDADAGNDQPDAAFVEMVPSPATTLRLTQEQYRSIVKEVLGDHIAVPARLEPDVREDGSLVLGAARTTISPRGAELYEQAATSIAAQALAPEHREALVSCSPEGNEDEACAAIFVRDVGRRLWRRTLTDEEVAFLTEIATESAAELGDFYAGLEYALSALLQSPKFLFRVEVGEDRDGARVLSDLELATRLSFFFWNSAPDDHLLDAAEAGRLATEDGLAEEIDRLMQDDRLRAGVRRFFSDLYELDRLDELVKAPEIFEHADEDVGPSAREETLRTIEWLVFEERGDFRDIFTTRTTFINRKLASIYNVPAPTREGFGLYEFQNDEQRAGFLGHASFLSLAAHPVSTSPTLRGKFIRQKVLCHVIPPPPAGVDTSIPAPTEEAPTLRARVQEHLNNPGCSSCHLMTDPIGLGLENFDGIGRYRTHDNGVLIEPAGELDEVPFEDALSLGHVLREHPDVPKCVTQKLFEYGTAHEVSVGQRAMMAAIADEWGSTGYDFLTLMKTVATSPAFRVVTPQEATDE